MDTTQNQPRRPFVNTTGTLSLGHGTNTWTDKTGTWSVARLGAVNITFSSAQQVRDVIAYLAGIAGEMDAETARNAAPGLVEQLERAARVKPADDAPLTGCVRCGATGVPLRPLASEPGLVCHNRVTCDARQAAKAAV